MSVATERADNSDEGPGTTRPCPDPILRDAAWNAVAVASTAWQDKRAALDRETVLFAYIATGALRYGLTVEDVAAAAGLTADQVHALVADGVL